MMLAGLSAYAVMATPNPVQVTQPDGSVLTLRLVGDEYHSYYTRMDGTPLRKLESGFFVEDFSVLAENQVAASAARRVAQQTMIGGGFPLTGSPKSVVILVGFKDVPFEQTTQNFYDLLNQEGYSYGGGTGSARDYFIAASNGVFTPTFDVYGPYTLQNDMAFYGAPEGRNHDKNAGAMIAEACQLADEAGVDFTQYDYNNDGILDNVFVYYAGHNQAEGASENTIWPHQSNISYKGIKVDGKTVASYACTSEYSGQSAPTRAAIGTFCHEFGHVLGLPDFYDTSDNGQLYTVGNWDIMSSGSYNNSSRTPPTYTSYERFYLGWLTPEQLSEPGQYMLEPLELSNSAYLIAANTHNLNGRSPSPAEFFLLECRENVGWDAPAASLPGTGMLVWHIDYSATAWNNNTPNNGPTILRMHLEEANGQGWQTRSSYDSGRATDAYPSGTRYTSFTPTLHNGTALLEQKVFDIEEHGSASITFVYKSLGDASIEFDKSRLDFVTTVSDRNAIVDWEPQAVMVTGHSLPDEIELSTSGNFYMYVGETYPARGNAAWVRTLTIAPVDSVISAKVWIQFKPSTQKCTPVESQMAVKGDGMSMSLPLSGTAARPTYVTTPELKPTANITPYSFQIGWNPVKDAEEYYITVYQVEKGNTTFTQSFESFNSYEAIAEQGWESNTVLTTTSAKADGSSSLYLKNNGDQVTTPRYDSPITGLSFWINAFTSDMDTVGIVKLEACKGDDWTHIKDIAVLRTTKKKTVEFEFAAEDEYTRFRLTYTSFDAGTALDLFEASCSEKITYISKGREMTIQASEDEAFNICNVNNLKPATEYFYKVQCTDLNKGCEEHLTDFSPVVKVSTVAGVAEDDTRHLALVYMNEHHMVYVPDAEGGQQLMIYDALGKLVDTIPTLTGQSGYELPMDKLITGSVYIVKYVDGGKMNRKQRFVKFIF